MQVVDSGEIDQHFEAQCRIIAQRSCDLDPPLGRSREDQGIRQRRFAPNPFTEHGFDRGGQRFNMRRRVGHRAIVLVRAIFF